MLSKKKKENLVSTGFSLSCGFALESEVKFNGRDKFYISPDGELERVQRIIASKHLFNPNLAELSDVTVRVGEKEAHEQLIDWLYPDYDLVSREFLDRMEREESRLANREINRVRAEFRARQKIYDYVACNHDLVWFVTWTLNGERLDRHDYKQAVKALGQWLSNRVKRDGLKYVIVPEKHKDGAVHFHGLVNDVLGMVDSGTMIPPQGGKPLKLATLRRNGFDLAECKPVFNLTDWHNGYTTAIHTYGERAAVAGYIVKYVTKSQEKVGGRYYLSGGELSKPIFKYFNADFSSADGAECEYGGVKMRIEKGGETDG